MESTFCHRLPKLELHAHLNGSLSQETLKELYNFHKEYSNIPINGWDSVFGKNFYSLSEFFSIFKITYSLTSTPEAIQIATERVIEDFSKDNVIYLELRSTLRKELKMTKQQYMESMIAGILKCRTKFPDICVKLIISINRGEGIESAEENVKLTLEYFKKYPDIIVGIDMSGKMTTSKFREYVKLLELGRSQGLKVTVHCAEIADSEEVKDILEFGPERIGHGTCIHPFLGGDENIWKSLLEKKVPVELCVSSNIKCHTVNSVDNHHFKFLYAEKHPIVLATDDKGVFETSLSKEFMLVQKTFGLSEEQLWELSYNSIDYIFADDAEKESLRTILNQWKIGNL